MGYYPKDKEEAYAIIKSHEKRPRGSGADVSKLHPSIRVGPDGRDASATISALCEVVKDLIKRIEALEGN